MSETEGSACLSKFLRYTLRFLQGLFRQATSFINHWRHPTGSWGFSQLSGSHRMISFWSCNRKRHSLYRLHCIQVSVSQSESSQVSNAASPFQAEWTAAHTVPATHCEPPLTARPVPDLRASPRSEHRQETRGKQNLSKDLLGHFDTKGRTAKFI